MSKTNSITQKHSQRNETREPENHRHTLDRQNREFVMRACFRKPPWYDYEVQEGEETPYGAENQVVDLGG